MFLGYFIGILGKTKFQLDFPINMRSFSACFFQVSSLNFIFYFCFRRKMNEFREQPKMGYNRLNNLVFINYSVKFIKAGVKDFRWIYCHSVINFEAQKLVASDTMVST